MRKGIDTSFITANGVHVTEFNAYILFISVMFLLVVSMVQAEDALDWYMMGENAATIGKYTEAVIYYDNAFALDQKNAAATVATPQLRYASKQNSSYEKLSCVDYRYFFSILVTEIYPKSLHKINLISGPTLILYPSINMV